MKKVYVVAAKRSAIGKFMGSLSPLSAAAIGAEVVRDILAQTKVKPEQVDEVIVGNVLSAGQGQGVARQVAIGGGVADQVPAYGINMVCGSGMKAVMNGYSAILSGAADLLLVGGTESMSNAGFVMGGELRNGQKMGNIVAVDHMVNDGLIDAFSKDHMGITAENIAGKYGITREDQDRFAFASQQKAIKAVDSGEFKAEITPISIVSRKETTIFDSDEYPNRTTTLEKLAALRPAFKKDGTVTAGNASGLNDSASFIMLASADKVKELGLTPIAEIISVGQGGVDPQYMGLGPVPAIRQALKNGGLKLKDMELMELNEAFAAQSLGVMKELIKEHGVNQEWIDERTNINGGAIALGHPIGASGNRIIVSLIHAMRKHGKKVGVASLCIGGGMGTAVIIKSL